MRRAAAIAAGLVLSMTLLCGVPATAGATGSDPNRAVFAFGDAAFRGSPESRMNAPLIAMVRTRNGKGYWLLGRDGGLFSFGNAHFYGSTGGMRLNRPVVGMAATPSGRGYWFVASDGGVFSFGNAHFYGSTGSLRLNRPVVGVAATPSGRGYWFVASDGGIFSFGDARFYGSTGSLALKKPIVGIAATPSGRGYWLVASDGGVFSFGDARFHGSAGRFPAGQTITGIATTPHGRGYTLVGSNGGVYAFGDARYRGSMHPGALGGKSIVGVVATPTGKGYWLAASGSMSPQQMAQQLLANPGVGKSGSFVAQDLAAEARGAPGSAGHRLDVRILRMLVSLARSHRFDISALESGGGGHSGGSRHFLGRAVDIDKVDGQWVTGRNAPAGTVMATVMPLMPPGGRFGQSNCGPTPPLPAGVTTLPDACNHLHIDVP